jgi:hypothetical protein
MDRRVPALFALGVALVLVTAPTYLFPHAGQPVYTHDIERVAASEVPTEADVLRYASLSAEAKAAIRDARTDDGVVYGEANVPPEFFYSDYAHLNEGIYYIEQNGTYYRLTTYAGGGLFPIDLFLKWGLILLGLGIGLVGYVSLFDRRLWLPAGFGVYGGLVLLGAVFQPGRGVTLGADSGPILVLALVGIVTALVAFGATAQRSLAVRTAGVCAALFAAGSGLWLLGLTSIDGVPKLPVNPIIFFLLALVSVLITVGYVGTLACRRMGA